MGIGLVSPDGTNERIVETGLPGASLSFPAWRRPAPLPTHRRACVITGTPGADVLRGKNRGDVLYGGAGDDRIYGAGGNDVLIGGPGHDRLFGGPGKDVFQAKDGAARLSLRRARLGSRHLGHRPRQDQVGQYYDSE